MTQAPRTAARSTAARLGVALLTALLLLGCASIGDGVDRKRSKSFAETMEHSFPDGLGQGRVLALLRDNGFGSEWRSGKPFADLEGEYLFARRIRRSRQFGAYIYEAGFGFRDGFLVERRSRVLFSSTQFSTPLLNGQGDAGGPGPVQTPTTVPGAMGLNPEVMTDDEPALDVDEPDATDGD